MTASAIGVSLGINANKTSSSIPPVVVGLGLAVSSIFGVRTATPVTSDQISETLEGIHRSWTKQTLVIPINVQSFDSILVGEVDEDLAAVTAVAESAAEQVQRIRDLSGLTWEQLSRLFGVSRRSVHSWASGARLSATHQEHLALVAGIMQDRAEQSPAMNRAWLLEPRPGGLNRYDKLRLEWRQGKQIDDLIPLQEKLAIL